MRHPDRTHVHIHSQPRQMFKHFIAYIPIHSEIPEGPLASTARIGHKVGDRLAQDLAGVPTEVMVSSGCVVFTQPRKSLR